MPGNKRRTGQSPADNPYGDDAGTRVGRPSTPNRDNTSGNAPTEGGDEAARGIHGDNAGGVDGRPGSEPLVERETEHDSGYGGRGGAPKRSSGERDLEEQSPDDGDLDERGLDQPRR